MDKVFLVWERECFDNYDVTYVTDTKASAVKFVESLTGKIWTDGDVLEYDVPIGHYTSLDVYIEERDLNKHYPLSI